MREFVISSDTGGDLSNEYAAKNGVELISLSYIIEGKTYTKDNSLPCKEFYDKVRAGAMPTTSQVNPEQAIAAFEPILKEGKDILHISFSSGLSGSCNSVDIAIEELRETYPEATIINIDSLCASLGQGLLVYHAIELKKEGKTLTEIETRIREMAPNIGHAVTVDGLGHLHRGGRVSKATAIIGGMANIKPVLHVNEEGKLASLGKARGRKKSLTTLVDRIEDFACGCESMNRQMIAISHADCEEDAIFVKEKIKERFGFENFMINEIGPIIGTHAGPGTVALFYYTNKR